MRRRGLLIASILILGVGLAAGAIVMRQSAQTTQIKEKLKTVKIVVVNKQLTRGVKLKKEDLKLREWPERLATPAYVRSIKEAEGRVVIAKTIAGEPLLREKLAPPDSAEGLSTLIPEGRRAIAVQVTEVTGVAGFLLPGSRVDVHATFKLKNNTRKRRVSSSGQDIFVTKTILQDVEVLAAGGEKEAAQKKGRIKAPVVTLLLTPQESDKLALAATAAQSIWLSMRKPRDDKKRERADVLYIDEILRYQKKKSSSKTVARQPDRGKARRRRYAVEVIQGDEKTIVKF